MLQTLINIILPVFLVTGAGYVCTIYKFFTREHIDGLMKFAQWFAIPCLLFAAIAKLDLSVGFNPRLLLSFFGGAGLCFALGMVCAHVFFRRNWEDGVVIGFCCLFSNSILLGLPITDRAFGPENLTGNFAIIALHSPFCYGLGIITMECVRNRGKNGWALVTSVLSAMFSNTLILSISFGFIFNISGFTLPSFIEDALGLIIASALPAALFALGGVLVQYRPEGDFRIIGMVCVIALFIHPVMTWITGRLLTLPEDLFRSAVLTAAMAPGVNAFIFATMYGRAKRVAASSVLIATGLSIISTWFWLTVLQ
ncbi:MAG: AEC family transporter [Aestuariivita sp.]|nr:AEC family transporter [Aestuariivita sp.]